MRSGGQGGFTDWLLTNVGVDPRNIHPSVRTALEGATLIALAASTGQTLADLLMRNPSTDHSASCVAVNGLLDCSGSPEECAAEAGKLVECGFRTLKLKVNNPLTAAWGADVMPLHHDGVINGNPYRDRSQLNQD
jgi:L-alanine-DL-glutamate epimerase-like enolase superfamily enzyme